MGKEQKSSTWKYHPDLHSKCLFASWKLNESSKGNQNNIKRQAKRNTNNGHPSTHRRWEVQTNKESPKAKSKKWWLKGMESSKKIPLRSKETGLADSHWGLNFPGNPRKTE